MRIVMALLLAGILAPATFAGLDQATDSFGVYFDTAGNTNCTTASAFQMVAAYLILMNPAAPTNGFECTVTMTGAPHFILSVDHCGSNIDCDNCSGPYSFAVGCPWLYPVPADGVLVLATWNLMLQTPTELLFRIGPGMIPSLPGGMPVVTGNGVLRLCQVASGDVNLPVAGINAGANCPVASDMNSFGTVKSLFR
jgi:hypothetical protein